MILLEAGHQSAYHLDAIVAITSHSLFELDMPFPTHGHGYQWNSLEMPNQSIDTTDDVGGRELRSHMCQIKWILQKTRDPHLGVCGRVPHLPKWTIRRVNMEAELPTGSGSEDIMAIITTDSYFSFYYQTNFDHIPNQINVEYVRWCH